MDVFTKPHMDVQSFFLFGDVPKGVGNDFLKISGGASGNTRFNFLGRRRNHPFTPLDVPEPRKKIFLEIKSLKLVK